MDTSTADRVRLANGLSVGYAEYGDPTGTPVLHFHGLPSCRFELARPGVEAIATRLGARVLVVERPGIGLSDDVPYTIATWPETVTAFADALGLGRFAVLGLSAGGKYVAACAWKIPERLTAAGIVSGTCPFDLPGAIATLEGRDKLLYRLADRAPWLLRLMLWKVARDVHRNPASVLSLFPELAEPDQRVLARPDMQQVLSASVGGAFAQGTRGVARDWTLEARPWGFPLGEIRMPVHLWHGEQDRIQPVAQGRLVAEALPDARATFYPEEGHLSLIANHYEELLSTLIE